MLAAFCPSDIHHQWPSQEMVCILAVAKAYRGGHRGTEAMDGAIRRMECLDIIKVVWHGSHLDHALSVVGCQALDLGTSRQHNESKLVESVSADLGHTCFETKLALGGG